MDIGSGEYKGNHLGIWPFRKSWYSICSMHGPGDTDEACNMCMVGRYINDVRNFIERIIFKVSPRTWIWWVNRGSKRIKNG